MADASGYSGSPQDRVCHSRRADQLIKGCQEFAAVYLDDLVIFSTTWEDHLKQLGEILTHIGEAGLTVKVDKCQFGMKQCVYLGHVVGNGMIQPEVSKVEVVLSFARLETKTSERLLGLNWLLPEIHPGLCNSGST